MEGFTEKIDIYELLPTGEGFITQLIIYGV